MLGVAPDYEIRENRSLPAGAENFVATSYFGLPLTISLQDAVLVLSVLYQFLMKVCQGFAPHMNRYQKVDFYPERHGCRGER
jgi:hypothetical protein